MLVKSFKNIFMIIFSYSNCKMNYNIVFYCNSTVKNTLMEDWPSIIICQILKRNISQMN